MKSSEEITKSLLERRDSYIADKKQKRKKTIGIVVPVCCFALVSLLVAGIYRGGNKNDTLFITESNKAQEDVSKNDSINILDFFTKENKETTKAGKPDKVHPNNKNTQKVPTTEPSSTEGYTDVANDFDTDSDKGKLPPNKEHNNNIGHTDNLSDASTENPDANKWINKIIVTQMPVKTVYYVGDTFDFRGLEITGYFSTGDVEDITPYVQFYNEKAYFADDTYRIFIEYTDNSDSINLACTEIYLTVLEPDVDISQKNITLDVGDCTTNSVITQATGCSVAWYSTDISVATVDNEGNITAVGSGTASVYAEISVYDRNGCSFRKQSPNCTVTVN